MTFSVSHLMMSAAAVLTCGFLAVPEAQAQLQDRTLRVGSWGLPPARGNPYNGLGTPSVFTWSAMYDMLTLVDEKGTAQPMLATSWKNTSPTTWEFKLRPATFHNGETVSAEGVIALWQWLQTDEGKAKGPSISARTRFIESMRAIDATTLEVKTTKPNPIVPNEMAVMMIAAPKALKDMGIDQFTQTPVGSGSYKLVGWSDTKATLTAADGAWDAPRVKNLEIISLPERPARVQAFVSNQLDVMLGLTADVIDEVKRAGKTIDAQPGQQTLTFGITQTNAKDGVNISPFQDKRVRQAMNHAVNVQGMADGLLGNGIAGVATGQGVAPSAFGYNPNVKPYSYDPAKARALLAEAGHATGLKFAIDVIPGAFPADNEIFQQSVADLQKAGIGAEARVITFQDWLPKFNNVTWDSPVWQNSWNAAPVMDATTAILNQSCLKAKPYLCDPKQQALMDAAGTEFDVEKRRKILQDLIQLQHDEAINIFLVSYNNIHAFGANVQGFRNINNTITYGKMSFK